MISLNEEGHQKSKDFDIKTSLQETLDSNASHPALKNFSQKAQASTQKPNVIENLKELLKELFKQLKPALDFDSLKGMDDRETVEMANTALKSHAKSQTPESMPITNAESKWQDSDFAPAAEDQAPDLQTPAGRHLKLR